MEKKNLIKIISFIAVSGIILLVFYHCPFLYFFGIPCPGCGMTRALISAAKLDFNAAFYYHPLFFLVLLSAIKDFEYSVLYKIKIIVQQPKMC